MTNFRRVTACVRLAGLLLVLTTPCTFAQSVIPDRTEDLVSVALLFSEEGGPPTPGAEFLDYSKLDYSLDSLKHVNAYLAKARKMESLESDWQKITLRAGAYVGEVMRRASRKTKLIWIDFETARKLNPEVFADGDDQFGWIFMLYGDGGSFSFPIAKVQKFLVNGPEDDVYVFATTLLEKD